MFLSHHYRFTYYFEILHSLFLILNQEEFQPVKHYLSRINTSRNAKLEKLWNSILGQFLLISFNFAHKTYRTLKMLLLNAHSNFYVILSSYVERHMRKVSSLNFMSFIGFEALKIWTFFLGNLLLSKFWNHFRAEMIP